MFIKAITVSLLVCFVSCNEAPSRVLYESCKAIRESANGVIPSGIYTLASANGVEYQTYCDMLTHGGGWSLVASIHENNAYGNGRCTTGDRWSSEQGNSANQKTSPNWQNHNVFGNVIAATDDDYKNPGYFSIYAGDVMIWQVPNETPLENWRKNSYLRYRTTSGFLQSYQGNLHNLYKFHYPVISGAYTFPSGNGPAFPIVFDQGTTSDYVGHFGPNLRPHITPGYMQFRIINNEKSAYALCPGHKVGTTNGNTEHMCMGSTGNNGNANICGDFAGWSFDGYGTHKERSVDKILIETTFLIFYR